MRIFCPCPKILNVRRETIETISLSASPEEGFMNVKNVLPLMHL